MAALDLYLRRVGKQESLIPQQPDPSTGMVVVIPAFAEDRLHHTITSLYNSYFPGNTKAEVLVVFNVPFQAAGEQKAHHQKAVKDFKVWLNNHSVIGFPVYLIERSSPDPRKSGVGFARKTGMDEAVFRFAGSGREDGVIVSLDADAVVDPDYLTAIQLFFTENTLIDGASVYFEHPLEGDEFPEEVYQAVASYELHLRYHVRALRYTGSPYAYHTVGSCFAVRASAYASLGGMNLKQGGEDFYFLQKVMDLGRFSAIHTTRVVPSPRPSMRVPFGTGPVVYEWLRSSRKDFLTYSPEAYEWLSDLFRKTDYFYGADINDIGTLFGNLNPGMQDFLHEQEFGKAIVEINHNVSSLASFQKRFFRWFNGFRTVKYLNHVHEEILPKVPVKEAAGQLLRMMKVKDIPADTGAMLEWYRKNEREG